METISFDDLSVIYTNGEIEISGSIVSYHSGRSLEYQFEPSWFSDGDSEEFWDQNWEDIEEKIVNQYCNTLNK